MVVMSRWTGGGVSHCMVSVNRPEPEHQAIVWRREPRGRAYDSSVRRDQWHSDQDQKTKKKSGASGHHHTLPPLDNTVQ